MRAWTARPCSPAPRCRRWPRHRREYVSHRGCGSVLCGLLISGYSSPKGSSFLLSVCSGCLAVLLRCYVVVYCRCAMLGVGFPEFCPATNDVQKHRVNSHSRLCASKWHPPAVLSILWLLLSTVRCRSHVRWCPLPAASIVCKWHSSRLVPSCLRPLLYRPLSRYPPFDFLFT